jgi:hypothetical protein
MKSINTCRNPTLRQVWGWNSHSQKWELGVLRDSRKFKAWLQGSKHLAFYVFFLPLERSWSVNVKMTLHEPFGHLQHKIWSKEGLGVKLAVWLPTTKIGNRPNPRMCRWNATHHWKALKENYKFASDLIPIGGSSWEVWAPKVLKVQTGTISRLILGSPRTKSHSNVGVMGKFKEYYMGEGGGFPRVRAVVSQVNPCCPWLVLTPRVISNVN